MQFSYYLKFVPDYVRFATECELHKHKVIKKQKNEYKFYECHTCGVVYDESGVHILWGTTKVE